MTVTITANLITNKNRRRDFRLDLDTDKTYSSKQIALLFNQAIFERKDIYTSITDIKINGKLIDYDMPVPLSRFSDVINHCLNQIYTRN